MVQESPPQAINIEMCPRFSGRNNYKTLLGGYSHNPAFMGFSEGEKIPIEDTLKQKNTIKIINAQGSKPPRELTQWRKNYHHKNLS